MAKRILDCYASDFKNMSKQDLLTGISKSEGRVIACETIGTVQPMLGNISNAELVSALGADLLLLNIFDVNHPKILGMDVEDPCDTIRELKRLTGRPVAVNLEPVSEDGEYEKGPEYCMTSGRRATLENAVKAYEMGADMILVTGNPGMHVSNSDIEKTLRPLKEKLGDRVIFAAGKMHASGIYSEVGERVITREEISRFKTAGADIIVMPAPGTVAGITMDYIKDLVAYAHQLHALTMTTIGTSQEGADPDTIRRIALLCKMTGTDIHHLGDAGYSGMALPENIFNYSVTIRGKRHTYHRMAASIER